MEVPQATPQTPATTYRCAACGMRSTVKEGFIPRKSRFSGNETHLCIECAAKKGGRSILNLFLVLVGFGIFFSLVSRDSWLGRLYLQLAAGLVLSIVFIIFHELSHALVAYLAGLRVFMIHLGAGKLVGAYRFLGLRWLVHQFPTSGTTIISGPEMPWLRLRLFLSFLAGPAFHVLLIAAMVAARQLWLGEGANFWLAQAVTVCLWTNVFILVTNLWPRKAATAVGFLGTDGWALFKILTNALEQMQSFHAAYYVFEAVDAVDRGDLPAAQQTIAQGAALYPDDAHILNAVGYVYSQLQDFQKARVSFLRLAEPERKLDALQKNMMLNNIAFSDLMLEDPALRGEADDYSRQAYEDLSWEPDIAGTRGAVLVWLGREEEGIDLLKKAMEANPFSGHRAIEACFIARGEMQRGNLAEARKYLEAARLLDPKCPLIERVGSEMRVEE